MKQDVLKNVSTFFNLAVASLARNLLLFFCSHVERRKMSGFVNHAVLLSPRYCAVPGILQFDYCHEGRAWVRIEVNCETDEIRYTSASGRSTEWHGEMRERHPFRPDLIFLQPDRSPRHQIMLLDFHSPYGFQHRLCLSQVSPFTWAGQHDVITTDRIVMINEES